MAQSLRRYFFTGLLVTLPLFLSIYILFILFRFVDGILGRFINVYLQEHLGFYIPGLGLILFLILVTLIGFLSSYFIGKKLYRFIDRTISQFPLLRYIYPSLKQIFTFLFARENTAFKKAWTIGFITNQGFKELNEKTGSELLTIFIPFAPNPTSGFLSFMPRTSVQFLNIGIADAMKLIVSGGVINPASFFLDSDQNKEKDTGK